MEDRVYRSIETTYEPGLSSHSEFHYVDFFLVGKVDGAVIADHKPPYTGTAGEFALGSWSDKSTYPDGHVESNSGDAGSIYYKQGFWYDAGSASPDPLDENPYYPNGVEDASGLKIPVDSRNFSPKILFHLSAIQDAYRDVFGEDHILRVTSGTEGTTHKPNSNHHLGRAMDFFISPKASNEQREALVSALREHLPPTDRIGMSTVESYETKDNSHNFAVKGADFPDLKTNHFHIDLGHPPSKDKFLTVKSGNFF